MRKIIDFILELANVNEKTVSTEDLYKEDEMDLKKEAKNTTGFFGPWSGSRCSVSGSRWSETGSRCSGSGSRCSGGDLGALGVDLSALGEDLGAQRRALGVDFGSIFQRLWDHLGRPGRSKSSQTAIRKPIKKKV